MHKTGQSKGEKEKIQKFKEECLSKTSNFQIQKEYDYSSAFCEYTWVAFDFERKNMILAQRYYAFACINFADIEKIEIREDGEVRQKKQVDVLGSARSRRTGTSIGNGKTVASNTISIIDSSGSSIITLDMLNGNCIKINSDSYWQLWAFIRELQSEINKMQTLR